MFKLELRKIGDRSVPKILVREGEYMDCTIAAGDYVKELRDGPCTFSTHLINNFTINVLRDDPRRQYNSMGLYAILRIIPIASEQD